MTDVGGATQETLPAGFAQTAREREREGEDGGESKGNRCVHCAPVNLRKRLLLLLLLALMSI